MAEAAGWVNESQPIKHTVSACRSGFNRDMQMQSCDRRVINSLLIISSSIPNTLCDSTSLCIITKGRPERILILLLINSWYINRVQPVFRPICNYSCSCFATTASFTFLNNNLIRHITIGTHFNDWDENKQGTVIPFFFSVKALQLLQ